MHVSRLILSSYRNHALLDVVFSAAPIVLYGQNGAGKTNILEAISYYAPGRGLRGAKLATLTQNNQKNSWATSLMIGNDAVKLSSTLVQEKRVCKIHGEIVKSVNAFSEWLSVHWLTPDHDRLFTDSSKVRRKFLDRFVHSYDPTHAERLVTYESALRERMVLLQKTTDDRWLSAIEIKLAELSVAISFARQDVLNRLEQSAKALSDVFPRFSCVHRGEMESAIYSQKAIAWEESLRNQFKLNRKLDKDTHMTHFGAHRADFMILHHEKGSGETCSTGEQKILLMGVMLSFLKNRLEWDDKLVVMLFDECVSHFDFHHRVVLFEQIRMLHDDPNRKGKFHAIMTGTDKELFSALNGYADFYHVEASKVKKG